MEVVRSLFAEEFWLPRNVSWAQMPSRAEHLLYPPLIAVPLLIVRILYESLIGAPLAWSFGVGTDSLSTQIMRHLRFGFAANTHSKRVLECFFRFSFYSALFVYGCVVLWGAPWLKDVRLCWIGYPNHEMTTPVWWYYLIETGFYWSLLYASVFDTRRTDFWQLVFHHFVTISLLSASWAINFVRVGTLILLSHDVSDITLEFAKLARYINLNVKFTNFLFFIFLTSWIFTRIGYFPVVILRSALLDAAPLIQPDYDLFNPFMRPYAPRAIIFLLFCLLTLHIFWTLIIVKIVYRTVAIGEAKDLRSDDEEEENEEGEGEGKARDKKPLLNDRKKKSNTSLHTKRNGTAVVDRRKNEEEMKVNENATKDGPTTTIVNRRRPAENAKSESPKFDGTVADSESSEASDSEISPTRNSIRNNVRRLSGRKNN